MHDLHVHTAPCVTARWGDDMAAVSAYEQAGFTGCVLKGHCEPTVGRAVAAGTGRSVRVDGGVVLNHPVGGLNPTAVAAALNAGGRVVWMPTVDALRHRRAGLGHPPSCAPGQPQPPGLGIPPLRPASEDAARTICELVAEADAVLATGHLSGPEIDWLVDAAAEAGVQRVVLTHPSFAVPGLDAATTAALCARGTYAEVTAYQHLRDGTDAGALAAFITAVGPSRCVLSSDAGHPELPSPPEALTRLVDGLVGAGVPSATAETMASTLPRELVVP